MYIINLEYVKIIGTPIRKLNYLINIKILKINFYDTPVYRFHIEPAQAHIFL